MSKKYDHINFKPPESVANAAAKGLEYRQKASPSNRGGLTSEEAGKAGIGSGVQRATNLKNRDEMSPETVRQMNRFFSRHQKNKSISAENEGDPWNDKGYVAWLLWGGDSGWSWAKKVIKQMDAADEKKESNMSEKAAAVGGKVTGNGTRVGLFIPLPDYLAERFPRMDDDPSPSHVTLLYVGEVPKARESEFLEVLTKTLKSEPSPVQAWLNGVDEFVHPHADRKVFYTPVRFSRDIGELRDRIWVELEHAGFEVKHSFPLAFMPHVTLDYAGGVDAEGGYPGTVPDGAWEFKSLQVWGLPKLHDIPMGEWNGGIQTMVDVALPDEDVRLEDKRASNKRAADLIAAWGDFLE